MGVFVVVCGIIRQIELCATVVAAAAGDASIKTGNSVIKIGIT